MLVLIIVSTNATFVQARSSIEPSVMSNGQHYDLGRYIYNLKSTLGGTQPHIILVLVLKTPR